MADSHDKGPMAALQTSLPRVTIQFCTQCKWMLRAAYYAQELLSTFSTSLGEVALQPSTGGTFVVTIYHHHHRHHTPSAAQSSDSQVGDGAAPPATLSSVPALETKVLWDRKTDGGFPETKELKRRVRDVIDPGRGLGHVDKDYGKGAGAPQAEAEKQEKKGLEGKRELSAPGEEDKRAPEECEDCKP